jgi:hypothetical protein
MGSPTYRDWAPAFPCAAAAGLASLLCLLSGGATPAVAQTDPAMPAPNSPAQAGARQTGWSPGDPSSRVRPIGAVARMLLEDGAARSPTVARLLEIIGRSDLIVYVTAGFVQLSGRLDFACAKPGVRFLRITVGTPDAEPSLIAALAHELQHAVEIADEPGVTDAASLARYYQKRGQRIQRDEYCTRAAQQTTDAVRSEVAAGSRPAR